MNRIKEVLFQIAEIPEVDVKYLYFKRSLIVIHCLKQYNDSETNGEALMNRSWDGMRE